MGDALFCLPTFEVVHGTFMFKDVFRQLHEFQKRNVLCDFVIKVQSNDDEEEEDKWSVKCHRVILACYSDYFRAMFTTNMKESKMGVVSLRDVDRSSIEMLVEFCYTHKITLSVENVQSLLHAASVLQMESVANYCSSFICQHINSSNCLNIREFGIIHGQMGLVRIADKFATDHFSEIVAASEFNHLPIKNVVQLLKCDDLVVESEKEVYEAAMKWYRYKKDERKDDLPELMENVRFPLVDSDYLISCVENERCLKNDPKCRDLIDEAKTYRLSLLTSPLDPKVADRQSTDILLRIHPRTSYAGFLMVAGGRTVEGEPIKSAECYDLSSDRWFYVSDMTTDRRHVGLVAIKDRIYAVGGYANGSHLDTAEFFDVKINAWTKIERIKRARRGLGLVNFGCAIYCIGGMTDDICLSTVERYDVDEGDWTNVSNTIIPRGGVATTSLDKHIYAIGGNDGMMSVSLCERYDPLVDKWTKICSLSERRAGAGIAALNGRLYVIGGFDGNEALATVECYDPKKNDWSYTTPLNEKRGGVGAATMAGKIYAAGGHDGQRFLDSVEVFDPCTGRWSHVGNLNTKRAGAGLAWCPSSIFKLRNLIT